jgi:hypothetical protein
MRLKMRSRRNSATPGLVALVKERCPHFLVAFVTHGERVVRAIESVTSLPLRPAAVLRPSTLLMRAIPQRHPVDEALHVWSKARRAQSLPTSAKYARIRTARSNSLASDLQGNAPLMQFLLNAPRFLFFTGKGGVGKTSIACATAIHWLASPHETEKIVRLAPNSERKGWSGRHLMGSVASPRTAWRGTQVGVVCFAIYFLLRIREGFQCRRLPLVEADGLSTLRRFILKQRLQPLDAKDVPWAQRIGEHRQASQQWSGAESLTKRMNSSQIAGITWAESCFSRASTASLPETACWNFLIGSSDPSTGSSTSVSILLWPWRAWSSVCRIFSIATTCSAAPPRRRRLWFRWIYCFRSLSTH